MMAHKKFISVASLHRTLLRLHKWLPYTFARSGRAFPAMHYYLEVTRRCNLRCVMCQYIEWLKGTEPAEQREGELSTEEWLEVVSQIPWFSVITFTGGEPLLRKDFLDILARASEKHRTHFITNATLLDDGKARRVAEISAPRFGAAGLNFVGISLDGPEPVHDRIRSMPGAFKKSAEGIARIVANREALKTQCPIIHVTTVIQKENLDYLSQMPRVVKELGADVLNFTLEVRVHELENFSHSDPAGYKREDVRTPHLDPEKLRDALRETRAAAREAGIELRTPDMPDEQIVAYYAGESDLRKFRCGFIWSGMFVGYRGIIYPCWLQSVGDVRRQTLKSAWNGPEFRQFRQRVRSGLFNPCAGCCFISYTGD
jgi:MoaA/NifB/PqqE/SkfB family radical SAM enzyme